MVITGLALLLTKAWLAYWSDTRGIYNKHYCIRSLNNCFLIGTRIRNGRSKLGRGGGFDANFNIKLETTVTFQVTVKFGRTFWHLIFFTLGTFGTLAIVCDHLWPYTTTYVCDSLWPLATVCDHLRPFTTMCDRLRQFTTIWDSLRPFATICDCLRRFATVCDHLRPLMTVCDQLRLFATVCDHLRTFATICDCLWPFGIFATVCVYLRPILTIWAFCDNPQVVLVANAGPLYVMLVRQWNIFIKCEWWSERSVAERSNTLGQH